MPAVRVGALVATRTIFNGTSQLVVPAKAALVNIYAWGAGARGAQHEANRYLKGGGAGAHAGLLGFAVTPGQNLYFSIPGQQTEYSNTITPTVVRAPNNTTIICKAMSPLDQTNNQQGYGAPAEGCIGDYAFKGGDGYINTNNTTHYGGGGGAAGTDGAGGTGQGGPGQSFGYAGIAGPGRTFIDSVSGTVLSPGNGGDTVGGPYNGYAVGGGGAARNPGGGVGFGAAGGVALEFFELPLGGAQIFIL